MKLGRRGTSSANVRGSSYDRRRRRRWIIARFGSPSGKTVKCWWCPRRLRTSTPSRPLGTFEIDRWPICGHDGGRYTRKNIVPSCPRCNASRCTVAGKRCRGRAPQRVYGFTVGEVAALAVVAGRARASGGGQAHEEE